MGPRTHRPVALGGVGAALVACLVLAGCTSGERRDAPDAADAGGDRVIARVDGAPLTAEQLERVMDADRLLWAGGGEPGPGGPDDPRSLRQRSFDLLVAGELMRQAALRQGIEVTREELDAQFAAVRSQFADDDAFEAYLAEAGLSREELDREARRRILIRRYARTVAQEIDEVTEADARRLWEQRPERFLTAEQVRPAWLLIAVAPGAPEAEREAARAEAERLAGRARAGEPFAELVREHSDGPAADGGGDPGYVSRGRMHPEFDRVVFDTPVGELTPVFETPMGFNLVRVLDRREPRPRPFEEVATGLLMVLARERRDEALRAEARRLRERATIEILDPELTAAGSR